MEKIIWAERPITLEDIKDAVRVFQDPNQIHANTACARKFFGEEATGPVAPGMMILGLTGGIIASEFGTGTIAHCVTDIKLSKCFCPGDKVGIKLNVLSDKKRGQQRFVDLEAVLFRDRGGHAEEASRKPIHVHFTCPIDQ
jgi:acyl dehydratase